MACHTTKHTKRLKYELPGLKYVRRDSVDMLKHSPNPPLLVMYPHEYPETTLALSHTKHTQRLIYELSGQERKERVEKGGVAARAVQGGGLLGGLRLISTPDPSAVSQVCGVVHKFFGIVLKPAEGAR